MSSTADVDLVFVIVQLVETIKFNTPIVMDFIQFGGLDILDKAYRVHKDDELLAGSIPNLRKILIGKVSSPNFCVVWHHSPTNLFLSIFEKQQLGHQPLLWKLTKSRSICSSVGTARRL